MASRKSYFEELKRRARESRVYRSYQLTGLEIAQILGDEKHKSLYIKLAKESNGGALLALAKRIREKRGVKNKGAYFMSCMRRSREK